MASNNLSVISNFYAPHIHLIYLFLQHIQVHRLQGLVMSHSNPILAADVKNSTSLLHLPYELLVRFINNVCLADLDALGLTYRFQGASEEVADVARGMCRGPFHVRGG